jgi:hypothetical protein
MRAALIKAFGEPTEVLELSDVPESSAPAEGEVLVGVEYLGNCHRPPPARALIEGVGFAADSPLEEAGFEPSVPRKTPAVVVISGLVAPPSPLRRAEPTRAPLSKPWSSHAVLTVRSGLFQR